MNKSLLLSPFFLLLALASCGDLKNQSQAKNHIKEFSNGASLNTFKNDQGDWGIIVENTSLTSFKQPYPVEIEWHKDSTDIFSKNIGYTHVTKFKDGFSGEAKLEFNDVVFVVSDEWKLNENVLELSRELKVEGDGPGGFLSAITFDHALSKKEVKYFAPGMIYGDNSYITKDAIGGEQGGNATWIREDRLPAPMFGIYAKDGSSLTILNPEPRGNTTKADSRDRKVVTMVDERFKFGAIGAEESEGRLRLGYKWPGTEGETTYRGYYFPGGQVHEWRRRYHPVKNGFTQNYKVVFRVENQEKSYPDFYRNAWRWAWGNLKPALNEQNIEAAQRSLVDMLAKRVETNGKITGLSNLINFEQDKIEKTVHNPFSKTVMGFTGKALESANFLLQDAEEDSRPIAKEHREKGLAVINSFLKLKLDPPAGEGFFWEDSAPAPALPRLKRVFIRSFGDGLKSILKAAKREKELGKPHPEWVAWAQSYADWLLPQQTENGGFPRAWEPVTGKVVEPSLKSSYNVIPYLLLLTELTGNEKYEAAAISAGEYSWQSGQSDGIFVGGTIDNPDVVDKEAGTLSLEAYLALYSTTKDKKWLERAKMAANFAETWIYIWDVPMPEDENDADLHWKKGVSTIGLQLISTGHSLVDAYMAFDTDEYAKLSVYSNDAHYMDVASILLHNTKGMLGLPERTYDLPGPGWQQEHWSLAPERGIGRKRAWLPWVTTSQLNGIFGLKDFDENLYEELIRDR
tara:strand:- start:32874 stop:35102 length:2229 start_codon:yes stop_codon:yes gene_type:complete